MNLKGYIFVLISIFVFNSCSDDKDLEIPSKRTVLAYMVASNLNGSLLTSIDEMVSVASKENLNGGNLIIFYSENKNKAQLLDIREDENGIVTRNIIREYTDVSAITKETMQSVFIEVTGLYPAESYGLILWSHGTAWLPGDYKNMIRSFGEESGNVMEIDDLADAIPDNLFDFIIFDACSMGSIETIYEFKDKANYIVSSPSEIWQTSFPYFRIIPYLFASKPELAKVANAFYEFYKNFTYPNGSVSVVNTKDIDELASITKEIIRDAGEEAMFALDPSSLQILSNYPPARFVDFADMIKQLASEEQYIRFESCLNKVVTDKYTTEYIYCSYSGDHYVNTFSGLSVYPIRKNLTELNSWYKSRLQWSKAIYE